MSFRIGSFNLRNIGETALGNSNPRNLKEIADIIKTERFDVVALQEVTAEGKAFDGRTSENTKKTIMMELGHNWRFAWADTSKDTPNRSEGYAFVWNTKRVNLAKSKRIGEEEKEFWPQVYNRTKRDLYRKPYFARFVSAKSGSISEIRLICIHTYYGNDNKDDRVKRKKEIEAVLKDVYPRIADKTFLGGKPAYTIVLGDYNMELFDPFRNTGAQVLCYDPQNIILADRWGDFRRIKSVQKEKTTVKSKVDGDENKRKNGGYAHSYDHFSYDVDRFQDVQISVERIDAVAKYNNNDYAEYKEMVSDHVPILMSIELR